jgi:hypothetical protein
MGPDPRYSQPEINVRHFMILLCGIGVLLVACGKPPAFLTRGDPQPVLLQGEQCIAQDYSVYYDELDADGGLPVFLKPRNGLQYRVNCGTVTTNCRLNESVQLCIATIEEAARRQEDSSDSSSYHPPTG